MTETIVRPGAFPASGRVTPASFPFFTTGEDNLRIVSYNTAPGVKLKINGRLVDTRGNTSPDSWDQTPNTDRSAKTTDLTLSGSTLLNITVFASAGAPLMGQTYVIVQLVRGVGTAAIVLGTILQGYVTTTQAIGFPGSPIQTSIDSGGYYRTLLGTSPAAGVEIVETCPAGARWDLVAAHLTLTTSATVIARLAKLKIVNTGHIALLLFPDQQVSNNIALNVLAAQVAKQSTFTSGVTTLTWIGLPAPCVLLAGDTFNTFTDNLQAGDQWDPPQYLVREWLEP